MKVSVILVTWSPTKERMDLLKQTLKSLRESTDIPYELIVVDNGPKEQTEFLKTQKIDKHIINEINKGPGFCKNQAIEHITGDFVAFIDNDLTFKKGWLEESIEVLESYPKKKFIVVACHTSCKFRKGSIKKLYENLIVWKKSGLAGAVFTRKSIEAIGKWTVESASDMIYLKSMRRAGYACVSLPFSKIDHKGKVPTFYPQHLHRTGEWRKMWGFPPRKKKVKS